MPLLYIRANYAIAQNYQHDFDQVVKKVDDLLWYEKVGDIAHIDKVYLCGPARWKETNPTGMSAGNELKFWTYIFIPKSVDPDKKYPLIVLPHSGVHADFNTYYAHIVRELIARNTSWSPLNTGVARGMARLLTIISITEDWKTRMSTLVVIIW